MKIWTEAYRPFIMGGDVNAPIYCNVPVEGPIDVGKGYKVFVATSPNGRTFIAESITGAVVGISLKEVCTDIRLADDLIMKKQITEAKERVLSAYLITPDEFWGLLRAA